MNALKCLLLLGAVSVQARQFSIFPSQRLGRATSVPVLGVEKSEQSKEELLSLIKDILPKTSTQDILEFEEATPFKSPTINIPIKLPSSLNVEGEGDKDWDSYIDKYVYEKSPPQPRNVEGNQFTDVAAPQMNLLDSASLLRQSDDGAEVDDEEDNEVRCVPKVMQVEETVFDRGLKCTHTFHEKCHMTYITDYVSATEEKCETTFTKECQITFKPMPFEEQVDVCHTPLIRQCGSEPVGPEICSIHYETSCETKYEAYEVEQDEPVCVMETVRNCRNITLPVAPTGEDEEEAAPTARQLDGEEEEGGDDSGDQGSSGGSITLDQECEDWQVQKCTLEKKTVNKVKPDTACRKIPREVCIPNNCAMVPGEEICKEENRVLIQNVPQEECELQPERNCYQDSVLVPKLKQTPNCVKVPKEICVNTKKNPRVVKKPVVKEWCYRPKDLVENRDSFPVGLLQQGGQNEGSLF